MLKQRVITAVLLVAILLPALFAHDPLWIASLASVLLGLAFWEWCRIIHCSQGVARLSAVALMALTWVLQIGPIPAAAIPAGWGLINLGWAFFLIGMCVQGVQFWQRIPLAFKWAWGAVSLTATWLALFEAKVIGVNFLLSVFCLVWAADIGAYFAGRAFGRHKLAPTLSPGKTWEGVAGAAVAVVVLGFFWQWLDQRVSVDAASFFTQSGLRWGWASLMLWAVMLAASVLGDLFESMLKRVAGVKDSSGLLPGHGGVLDRIDALLPVLPLALWALTW